MFELCDRVTVMRDGRSVETRPAAAWSRDQLVQAMVNRPIDAFFPKQAVAIGAPLLEVSGLAVPGRVRDVSFALHAGEILGIAGLVGAGRTEILKALYGALRLEGGQVRVAGQTRRIRGPRDAIRAGLALVPEDRKGEGLILPFALRQNVSLSVLPRLAWLRTLTVPARINALARRAVSDLRIRTPGIRQAVRNLSGGNQQKVVLARAMIDETPGLPARRADARHRCRRQGRGLFPDRRPGGRRRRHPGRLVRTARTARHLRPHPGDAGRPARGRGGAARFQSGAHHGARGPRLNP